jgi:hypothetical protein
VRYSGTTENRKRPQPVPVERVFEEVKSVIRDRVKAVNPEESERVMRLLEEKIESWRRLNPEKYWDYSSPWENTLFCSPDRIPSDEEIKERMWFVPTSMRNVDLSCEAKVIGDYT